MSSVICVNSFLECLIYEEKRLTTTTIIKCYNARFPGNAKLSL